MNLEALERSLVIKALDDPNKHADEALEALSPRDGEVFVDATFGGGGYTRAMLEQGARVILLESAPKAFRGGNSRHTRNLRCMHDAPQDVLTEAYPEEEFWQDLLKVTGGHGVAFGAAHDGAGQMQVGGAGGAGRQDEFLQPR